MATLAHIPNEIIQEIIDHISPNISYTSLSLISRSWFSYLLDRRFNRVCLDSKTISRFLVLLQSPLCTFRQSVRHLYIHSTLGELLRHDQEMIHALTNKPTRVEPPLTPVTPSKSIFKKFKNSMKPRTLPLTPVAGECHLLNIVCLFPHLEHLQVQLMAITSYIPGFHAQPPLSPALKSVSVICNGTPPNSPQRDTEIPPEWGYFLNWIRSNKMHNVCRLYITGMAWWDYKAAEILLKLQGNSLKHLHLGPQALVADVISPRRGTSLALGVNVESVHFDIIFPNMLAVAADMISQIPPTSVVAIGLDMVGNQLVRDAGEIKNLERLAHLLETRGFVNLHQVYVRMKDGQASDRFEEAARIVRSVFPKTLLTVKHTPYDTAHIGKDVIDDCARWEEGGGKVLELGPSVPVHRDTSIPYTRILHHLLVAGRTGSNS